MKFAQNKSPAQTNRQEGTPLPLSFGKQADGPSSGRLLLIFSRTLKLYEQPFEKPNGVFGKGVLWMNL
jgi:hypothetical protein